MMSVNLKSSSWIQIYFLFIFEKKKSFNNAGIIIILTSIISS